MTCYHSFLTDDILFQKLHSYVNSWLEMDKLEQDQFVACSISKVSVQFPNKNSGIPARQFLPTKCKVCKGYIAREPIKFYFV